MRILVVDDEEIAQMVIKKILNELGCDSTVVGFGSEALDLVATNNYDLIFMDLYVADMDGFNIIKRIRGMNKDTPIVILTAHPSPGMKKRALVLGSHDFLSKPITLETCKLIIDKYKKI